MDNKRVAIKVLSDEPSKVFIESHATNDAVEFDAASDDDFLSALRLVQKLNTIRRDLGIEGKVVLTEMLWSRTTSISNCDE